MRLRPEKSEQLIQNTVLYIIGHECTLFYGVFW